MKVLSWDFNNNNKPNLPHHSSMKRSHTEYLQKAVGLTVLLDCFNKKGCAFVGDWKPNLRQGLDAYNYLRGDPRKLECGKNDSETEEERKQYRMCEHCTGYCSGNWSFTSQDPLRNSVACASHQSSKGILMDSPGALASPNFGASLPTA
ncbi:hypothetical protein mRhiFer1_009217 [Rhinolophus ferrumequinum]|uniref:Uncharacterized protein n=1 Tax=Rhinolophus ferrumequinum TaxID=59479 RepID=A0A7J7S831_RHIFE|nr:hypothetical protein mRhiFer1_009217 [Rhinolophus ferrumequinum]